MEFQLLLSLYFFYCLSMESIRLGGLAHGIVTKTVHNSARGVGGLVGRG